MDTISREIGTIQPLRGHRQAILAAIGRFVGRIRQRMAMHRELQQLYELDDRLLRDIGVRREDIARAERELLRGRREQ